MLQEMNRSELAVVVIPKKRLVNAKVVDMDELRRNPEGVVLPQIVEPDPQGTTETAEPKGKRSAKAKSAKGKKSIGSQPSNTAPMKLPQLVPPAK